MCVCVCVFVCECESVCVCVSVCVHDSSLENVKTGKHASHHERRTEGVINKHLERERD